MDFNNKFELRDYIEQHPGTTLYCRLAELHLKEGEFEDALDVCREGLRQNDANAMGHFFFAKAALMSGDTEAAVRHLKSVIRLDPSFMEGYKTLIEVLPATTEPSVIREYCERVIRINPRDQAAIQRLKLLSEREQIATVEGEEETAPELKQELITETETKAGDDISVERIEDWDESQLDQEELEQAPEDKVLEQLTEEVEAKVDTKGEEEIETVEEPPEVTEEEVASSEDVVSVAEEGPEEAPPEPELVKEQEEEVEVSTEQVAPSPLNGLFEELKKGTGVTEEAPESVVDSEEEESEVILGEEKEGETVEYQEPTFELEEIKDEEVTSAGEVPEEGTREEVEEGGGDRLFQDLFRRAAGAGEELELREEPREQEEEAEVEPEVAPEAKEATGKAQERPARRRIAAELATWTMYSIYKNQKLYDKAWEILEILEMKLPEDKARVQKEKKLLEQLMQQNGTREE